ncbi:MAG: DUF975 family protein [Patescibacteria group bacterium]
MTTEKFSKKEAIKFGWEITKNNLVFFIGLLIVAGLISTIPSIISEAIKTNSFALYIVINIVSQILGLIIGMGLIRITLKFCDNKKGEFSDLFSCFPLFFKYLLGSILYGLIVLGGMILLIVPGIIWAIEFQFFGYFIVDKGLGPIEALKKSSAITKNTKWDLFLFSLLLIGINLLGILCLGVGLFAAIPTIMVATAFVYRKLLVQIENITPSQNLLAEDSNYVKKI